MKRFFLIILMPVILAGLFSCGAKSIPVVGISCSHPNPGSDRIQTTYTQAILRAGGVPLILPTIETAAQAEEILSRIDAILFSGGEDVNPSWYGEAVWNETVETNPVRDRSDSLLARAALASGKPVLGICRGGQLLNVILGGSLYQDIPSQVAGTHTHRNTYHKIGIEKGSVLDTIFGKDSITVNSLHHQAVMTPAPGITVTAWSDDGIVEAWEYRQIWAFQFHPEKLLKDDYSWLPVFKAFLARVK